MMTRATVEDSTAGRQYEVEQGVEARRMPQAHGGIGRPPVAHTPVWMLRGPACKRTQQVLEGDGTGWTTGAGAFVASVPSLRILKKNVPASAPDTQGSLVITDEGVPLGPGRRVTRVPRHPCRPFQFHRRQPHAYHNDAFVANVTGPVQVKASAPSGQFSRCLKRASCLSRVSLTFIGLEACKLGVIKTSSTSSSETCQLHRVEDQSVELDFHSTCL